MFLVMIDSFCMPRAFNASMTWAGVHSGWRLKSRTAIAATRALGHPARMRAAAMLRSGELCLCQITEVLKLAPSTVSAHLKELKRAGLIEDEPVKDPAL